MPANPTLTRVRRAAHAVRSARDEYRAAILAARESGATFTAIGDAAGVTRQAARQSARVSLTQSETTTEEE